MADIESKGMSSSEVAESHPFCLYDVELTLKAVTLVSGRVRSCRFEMQIWRCLDVGKTSNGCRISTVACDV